jgi:hypothetical protein
MRQPLHADQCLAFINCHMKTPGGHYAPDQSGNIYRTVTISREAGSGGHAVAEELARVLQAESPNNACPWTVFDRDIVERVLEDHHLSKDIARFMPEDRISALSDTLDELFGLHPPSEALVRDTADTILQIADLGRAIIIGRGATVITAKLKHVFHVRLIAPLEKRVETVRQERNISTKEAMALVHAEDGGRRRFMKKYLGADIDDPLLYHLTINTDKTGLEQAARLIAKGVLQKQPAHLPQPQAH